MTEDEMEVEVLPSNQLQTIIKESELSNDKASVLMGKFANFFSDAELWAKKAKAIKVTNESQKVMMDTARQGRLFLRKIRLEIENIRKGLKEESLREGRAIDKVAKILKEQIEPIEEYLDKQEHFVEYREAEKEAVVRIEIEKKMEEERLAEEKRKVEEAKTLRKQVAQAQEELRVANEAQNKKIAEINRQNAEKLAEANAIAQKAERELREKRQAEMKAEADAIRKAEVLKSASDIVKIQKLLEDLEAIKFPTVASGESYRVVSDAMSHVNVSIMAIKKYIQSKVKNEEEI